MPADMSLIPMTAVAIRDLLAKGEITPLDLLDTLEARVAAVDPQVNALPTLCFDRARDHARALMEKPAGERGVLGGIPVAIKDLTNVEGVRSTMGSPIFADTVPDASDLLITHLEGQGGIVCAKSNTPEFGAGANTFNEVFGRTLNPWNTARSVAGSSGGAAASLASGTSWLAHGSDLGGSLRNPASFCGIVGMRPSPGRCAATPGVPFDQTMGVEGPMARNVADLALLFDAMVGEEPRDPLSLPSDGVSFLASALSARPPRKVAFTVDFGITPVDPEVRAICTAAAQRFSDAGVIVEEATPDLSEARECFAVLRAALFVAGLKPLYDTHRDKLKPDVIWNIEEGLKLTVAEIARAQEQRLTLLKRAWDFFADYDLIIAPSTIVAPFPVEQTYVAECDGHRFANYIEWLTVAYPATLWGAPSISIPAGFTTENLPVGIQMIAPPRGEHALLSAAKVLETILWPEPIVPIDPRPGA